jgi:DNA primase
VEPSLDPATFNIRTAERRLAGRDPWADFWQKPQRLTAAA